MTVRQHSSQQVFGVSQSGGTVGSGRVRERAISAPGTPRIAIVGPFRAELTVDPDLVDDVMLRFRADDNVLPRVRARLRAGVLEIGLADGSYAQLSELAVRARVGRLVELSTDGRATAIVHGLCGEQVALRSGHASLIKASGSARSWRLAAAGQSLLQLEAADTEWLTARACDASSLQLSGACAELELHVQGAARVLAARPAFQACRAHVELSEAARASLCVRERVTGRVRFPARLSLACRGEVAVQGAHQLEPSS